VNRSRVMSLALGVALAILVCRWAWQLGGPLAAVAAAILYCLDPNFLGHSPLVKNDVPFALIYFAAAYAAWRLGRRFTWVSLSAVALLTAAAVNIKLSGVLLAPVLIAGLSLRACMNEPWEVFGKLITSRGRKFLAAAVVWVLCIATTYAMLWATYGFRFNAGPDGMTSDTAYFVHALRESQLMAQTGGHPTDADRAAWKTPLSTRVVLFMEAHHLLPQAWTAGFVLTQFGDQNRGGFLMDQIYSGGKWYYFPLAALFKTPLATLAAALLAAGAGISALKRGEPRGFAHEWAAIALLVPAGFYGGALLLSNLNIGLRHAFPVYPFAYMGIALAAPAAWRAGLSKPGQASGWRVTILVLSAALAAETAAAFPNYIAFFNVAAASHRLDLLSDSNLDWGQDLPGLASWQRANPNTKLYLDYFGLCDPAAYGIKYTNVPTGYIFGDKPVLPTEDGVVAVSATNLQGVYGPDPMAQLFQGQQPIAVIGDTIYLFKLDIEQVLRAATRP
jgi:hypothetical protein